jgi:hypothetical protein
MTGWVKNALQFLNEECCLWYIRRDIEMHYCNGNRFDSVFCGPANRKQALKANYHSAKRAGSGRLCTKRDSRTMAQANDDLLEICTASPVA